MSSAPVSRRRSRAVLAALCVFVVTALAPLALSSRAPARAEAPSVPTLPPTASPRVEAPPPPPMTPIEAATLEGDSGAPAYVFPPLVPAPKAPVVMFLHGMCMDAERTCEAVEGPAREASWLVCPRGNASCGGGADWQGDGARKAAFLDQGLSALDHAYGGLVTHGEGVIIGFSRGAFVARDVLYERKGEWSGAIFMGAAFIPDAARLREAGVRRAVFASGDYDGARSTMQKAARTLSAQGLEARFVSLGPIAHQLPHDAAPFIREALSWIRQAQDAPGS